MYVFEISRKILQELAAELAAQREVGFHTCTVSDRTHSDNAFLKILADVHNFAIACFSF